MARVKQFMRMTRLIIIPLFVLFLAACGGGGDSTGSGDKVKDDRVFNWKMVTTWPPGFPIFQEGAESFARQVKTMSGRSTARWLKTDRQLSRAPTRILIGSKRH